MKKKSLFAGLLASLLALTTAATLAGCGESTEPAANSGANNAATQTVTDVIGRTVEVPQDVDEIIGIGSSSLRILSYADTQELLVGVERAETETPSVACTYSYLNQEKFKTLPVIGEGGSGGTIPYEEEIITAAPDVIFAGNMDADTADKLQDKTSTPVVVIQCNTLFDPALDQSLELVGKICDKEERCNELIDAMQDWKNDLNDRTKDVQDKPSVYVGALNYRGSHGIEGTEGFYGPLEAVNAVNVANETGTEGFFTIEKEKLLSWNPDILFLDPTNLSLVQDDYKKNPDFYDSLTAVQNGEIYAQPAFRWYAANVEVALADAYYAGKVLYPDQFKDINIKETATEIFTTFHGEKAKDYYDDLAESGLTFTTLSITK